MHYLLNLEKFKNYIKIHTNIAPTLHVSVYDHLQEIVLNLVKVIFTRCDQKQW